MRRRLVAASLLFGLASISAAQLRVTTWNISNYGGGRTADIQAAVFGVFEGRSMNPDVILGQEFTSQSAVNAFVNALNAASGSSGNWSAAPFLDGPDTDSAFFFRTDRITYVATTTVVEGGGDPLPPRDVQRYDIRLKGYAGTAPKLALYSVHMKSGDTSGDEDRRLAEALLIRNNAQALDSTFSGFLVGGDFNVYRSSDRAFTKLTASETNNLGRFWDPISTPGSWNANSGFKVVHTQDPSGSGGMDSRFDFILLSSNLFDGAGFDYIGQIGVPYSDTTWNDLNHSYRSWGNDGTSFNQQLKTTGNTMVGPAIAQALINAATTAGGHLPVFLDLRVPAEIQATPSPIDFGNVVQGTTVSQNVSIANGVNTTLWRTGIADLNYTLTASSGFTVPGGTFSDSAGGGQNSHAIGAPTSTLGVRSGTLTIASTVGGVASVVIPINANVIPEAIAPAIYTLISGTNISGGLPELAQSDDQKVLWRNDRWSVGGRFDPVYKAEFEATSSLANPASMTFHLEAQANGLFSQDIELYDFVAQGYVKLDIRATTPTDSTVVVNIANPGRYVEAGTLKVKARLTVTPTAWSQPRVLTGGVDRVVWKPR